MRKAWTELGRGLSADAPILAFLFVIWAGLLALLAFRGVNGISFTAYQANLILYGAAFLVSGIFAILALLVRHRPDRPIGFLAASFGSTGFKSRLVQGAPMLAGLVIFLPLLSKMKAAIPLFNSFAWDETWIRLDRILHGTDPWRLLQPVFGFPLATSVLAVFYHLWLMLLYIGGIYFCFFQADKVLRARFFIAYFACWVLLGIAAATAFASVGPCFVGPLLGDHRFDEQMAYLRSADEVYPIMVLSVQAKLAAAFHAGSSGLGSGITAMPSMHVSLAFLFFLAMRKVSKPLGIVFGVFAAIILIGSVHLAYHYAVDGYVSILATGLIWLAAGPLARRVAARGNRT